MSFSRRALLALAISMAVPVCAAQAATFNIPSGDVAALKSAINSANASAQNDVINLAAGTYTLATAQDTSSGPTALPPIQAGSGTLTINGKSATVTRSTAQGAPFCRALKVEKGAVVVIKDLKIYEFRNIDPKASYANDTARQGGAIENLGKLTLTNCDVSVNESLSGGAISNEGTLTVNQGIYNYNRARRGGSFKNSGTATFNKVVCSFNDAGTGGSIENTGILTVNAGFFQGNESAISGMMQNSGTATLKRTKVILNRSFSTGAINNDGTLTLIESLLTGSNSGGISNRKKLVVRQSLILGNSSSNAGAGIYTTGTLEASNSTFANNSVAPISGGFPIAGSALAVDGSGSASLDSCTFANNSAPAAIAVKGGTLTLRNSIVARNGGVDSDGNRTPGDIEVSGGSFRSGGNNLIGSPGAVTGFIASDQVGTDAAPLDPKLGELGDNGGATSTYTLLAGSPAIDKGNTAQAIDQRGLPRPAGSADDIGAFEAQSAPIPSGALIVTTLADVEDETDGVLSLREAMTRANANDGPDTIRFADNVRGAIALTRYLPAITYQLTIEGPGASLLALDGTNKTNILSINGSETIAISGLTFCNGNGNFSNNGGGTGIAGGAIGTSGLGLLQLRNCAFLDNRSYNGGAIHSSGNLLLEGCTFSGNSAISSGAVFVSGIGATIRNSTFTGNSVVQGLFGGASEGSGIYVSTGSVRIDSCTITDNTISGTPSPYNVPGGGVSAGSAADSVEIRNSILSGNTNGDVVIYVAGASNPFISKGNNLVGAGNAVSAFSATGDRVGINAKLGPLANNGGPTQTRALLAGSPAIDAGNTTLTTDQRGFARPQGNAADIGAYEDQAATLPPSEKPSLIVTTLADAVANDGQTSLREAMNYANSKAGADRISFADNVRGTITLSSRLPEITDALTIAGVGARLLAVDGGGAVRLLAIGSGVSANIYDLTLSGARYDATQGPEGAIVNRGNLSLVGIALTGNAGIEGGAVTNLGGSVNIKWSQITGNSAVTGGGGLLNNYGTINVNNSTIANNTVTGGTEGGGAISTYGGNLTLDCVTLSGNSAPKVAGNIRAGVWIESGTLTLHNSILYGNGARDLQIDGGTVSSQGYNLIGKTSGTTGLQNTDILGVDPKLGALADNGGATKTVALLAGSRAINAGDPAAAGDFEQRGGGFARVRAGRIDIGAFEVQSDASTSAKTASSSAAASARTANKAPSGGHS